MSMIILDLQVNGISLNLLLEHDLIAHDYFYTF